MNFQVLAPSLSRLDELKYDTLVLTHFDDERPLTGVGGMVDWRINGRLSELVLGGFITGEFGERLLYPQQSRLPFSKILYFGLGDRSRFTSTRYREAIHNLLQTMRRIGVWSFAMCLPGSQELKMVPRQMVELFLHELQHVFIGPQYHDLNFEIGILEHPTIGREVDEQLQQFVRQFVQERHR
ncbi:MAG: M17 family peptidase N-terminal domain-containing protein [Myxococcota bacterium]|nr:M17 family peptidase N-terminal domain-containing protein [Myxococcota bacterium]